jgi:ABC-type Mn2+/Zn2+ transport system permease subunit
VTAAIVPLALVEPLIEPLVRYPFMRTGLLASVVVGVVCAVLSCLLVVRGQALLGDAISHAVLLGVVVGYLVGGEMGVLVGALAVAVLTGAGIVFVTERAPFRADTAMGVLFTVTFAGGLAIISVVRPRGIDLFHVLFGNVLGVTAADLTLTAISGGLVLAVVLVGFRAFELWSFDPQLARAMGMPTRFMEHLFTALLAAAIVASLQTVGLVLVVAMLIVPGATAAMVTSRLGTMMATAAGVGLLSATAGLYGSYHLDIASGPAIVLAAGACFLAVFVAAPRGLLAGLRPRPGRRGTDPLEVGDHPPDIVTQEVAS